MKLPGLSAAKCACQTCLVSKTVRNLLFVEAFWLLPKGLGETATAGEEASFFIIWRENLWTDKVQVSLVKKCFSNNVFLSFALVKTRSHLKIWSQTTYFRNSPNQSNWFFYICSTSRYCSTCAQSDLSIPHSHPGGTGSTACCAPQQRDWSALILCTLGGVELPAKCFPQQVCAL